MRLSYSYLTHFVDVLAFPFFFLAVLYFAAKPQRSPLEYALFAFAIVGLFVDSILSSRFLGSAVYILAALALTLIAYHAYGPIINAPLH